jgi:hypothetical protein
MNTNKPTNSSGKYFEVRISSATNPIESELVRECKSLEEANALAKELHDQGKAAFVRYPRD